MKTKAFILLLAAGLGLAACSASREGQSGSDTTTNGMDTIGTDTTGTDTTGTSTDTTGMDTIPTP